MGQAPQVPGRGFGAGSGQRLGDKLGGMSGALGRGCGDVSGFRQLQERFMQVPNRQGLGSVWRST